MKVGDPAYLAALQATVPILETWAQQGEVKAYSDLSRVLRSEGHPVHFRGQTISHLLKDACLRGRSNGHSSMLSAIVVSKQSGRPSGQFFELARETFHRTADTWSWEQERDHVFADYQGDAA